MWFFSFFSCVRQNERLIHEWWQCVSGCSDPCFFEYRTVSAGLSEAASSSRSVNPSAWHATRACVLVNSPHAARIRNAAMSERHAVAVRTDTTLWHLASRAREPGWRALMASPISRSLHCNIFWPPENLLPLYFLSLRGQGMQECMKATISCETENCKDASSIHQDGSWYGKFRRRIWNSRSRTVLRCIPELRPYARVGVCLQRYPATATCQFHPFETIGMVCLEDSCKVQVSFVA